MIRINLLPVEKRKAERTPLPRFGLVVLDVGVLVGIVFLCLWIYVLIVGVESDIARLKERQTNLTRDAKEYDQLVSDIKKLEGTLREIDDTVGRKIEWWRVMDSVWEVIHFNPRVWVHEINVIEGKATEGIVKRFNPAATGTSPYGLLLRSHCAGKDVSAMTKFRMELKRNTELKKWFGEVNWDAQWDVQTESGFVEQYSMQFDVQLIGKKAPPPPPKAPPKPAPGAAR